LFNGLVVFTDKWEGWAALLPQLIPFISISYYHLLRAKNR